MEKSLTPTLKQQTRLDGYKLGKAFWKDPFFPHGNFTVQYKKKPQYTNTYPGEYSNTLTFFFFIFLMSLAIHWCSFFFFISVVIHWCYSFICQIWKLKSNNIAWFLPPSWSITNVFPFVFWWCWYAVITGLTYSTERY